MSRFYKYSAAQLAASSPTDEYAGLRLSVKRSNTPPPTPAAKAASQPKPAPVPDRSAETRIGVERTAATNAERARWAKVFASKASAGRERDCVALLSASQAFSAVRIVDFLTHEPGGNSNATRPAKPANAAAIDAIWDRAHSGSTPQVAATAADASWAKAYASVGGR